MTQPSIQPFSASINTGNQDTAVFIEGSHSKNAGSTQKLGRFSDQIDFVEPQNNEKYFSASDVPGTKGLDRIMKKIYSGKPLTQLEKARFKPEWEQIKHIAGKLGIDPKPFVTAMALTGKREFREAFGDVAILLARVSHNARLDLEEIRFLQKLWPKKFGVVGTSYKPLRKALPKVLTPLEKAEKALVLLAKKAGKTFEKQALRKLATKMLSLPPFVGPVFWAWDVADLVKSRAFKDSFKKLMKAPVGKRALLEASESEQISQVYKYHPRIPAGEYFHPAVGWY